MGVQEVSLDLAPCLLPLLGAQARGGGRYTHPKVHNGHTTPMNTARGPHLHTELPRTAEISTALLPLSQKAAHPLA